MGFVSKVLSALPFSSGIRNRLRTRRVETIQRANFRIESILQGLCSQIAINFEAPVFVKVGANDGLTGDPFKTTFLIDSRWRGILVEAVPHICERLRANYPSLSRFEVIQAAVGRVEGPKPFYFVGESFKESGLPEAQYDYDQLGSFSREHIEKHFGGVLAPYIVETEVNVVTLNSLLARKEIQRVHVLHIDTEGFDLEVLQSIDLKEFDPLLVLVEHKHLSRSQKRVMRSLLIGSGYEIADLGSDFCATKLSVASD